jgi:hypothetical protein
LVTILLIYKVLQHQDESFLLTCIVIHLQFNINDRHISLDRGEKRGGGGSALNICSIFYTHHRIPNETMMTINFDTIANNYEVIFI